MAVYKDPVRTAQ